jgi:hypothetical protein
VVADVRFVEFDGNHTAECGEEVLEFGEPKLNIVDFKIGALSEILWDLCEGDGHTLPIELEIVEEQ